MPTCDNPECGYKESGRYFKNKVCPKCDKPQFPSRANSIDDIPESPILEDLSFNDMATKSDSEYGGFLGNSDNSNYANYNETESYGIPEMSSLDKLDNVQDSSDIGKVVLSSSEWRLLTLEIYGTIESMLKTANPEFYNSESAQNLRNLNARLSAIVLSSKEVNPMRILLLTNIIYILPALRGLNKKKSVRSTKQQKGEFDTTTQKHKEPQTLSKPNKEFYND